MSSPWQACKVSFVFFWGGGDKGLGTWPPAPVGGKGTWGCYHEKKQGAIRA